MSLVGRGLILIALLAAVYAIVAALYSRRSGDVTWQRSAERAVYAVAAAVTGAVVVFEIALLTDNFGFRYVAEYSSRDLPTHFKLTSLWASQAGSLMLWLWIMSMMSALVVFLNRHRNRELMPIVVAVLMGIATFFAWLVTFATSPFETVVREAEGKGLNPLLQNEYMVAHPPVLYVGYVGLSIPFAFAIAALVTRRLDTGWITATRRWTVISWLFLGFGILLGARWAYNELGWGGYWFWDAVENAALMPWLVSTAFLHSIMVQERRGMLKVWNMILVALAFLLALFGTFITRSGLMTSIHAFGESTVGPYFLGAIVVLVTGTLILLFRRLDDLKSTHALESYLSREAVFLYNNLLLVGMAFAVWWGTMFPVFSEIFRGRRIAVGAPFFDQIAVPIGIALLLLTGIGPLIPWRKARADRLAKALAMPTAVALVGGLILFVTPAWGSLWGGIFFTACIFVVASIVGEFVRGTRVRHAVGDVSWPRALVSIVGRNRRRYGGYIVHLGVVVLVVGLTGSSAYEQARDVTMREGDQTELAGYRFVMEGSERSANSHVRTVSINVGVYDSSGKRVTTLTPSQSVFVVSQQQATDVSVHTTPARDIYAALLRLDDGPEGSREAVLSIYVTPLVAWIWSSGMIIVVGTLIAAWPARRRKSRDDDAPQRRATPTSVGAGEE